VTVANYSTPMAWWLIIIDAAAPDTTPFRPRPYRSRAGFGQHFVESHEGYVLPALNALANSHGIAFRRQGPGD